VIAHRADRDHQVGGDLCGGSPGSEAPQHLLLALRERLDLRCNGACLVVSSVAERDQSIVEGGAELWHRISGSTGLWRCRKIVSCHSISPDVNRSKVYNVDTV
jgi:hypothetical protein